MTTEPNNNADAVDRLTTAWSALCNCGRDHHRIGDDVPAWACVPVAAGAVIMHVIGEMYAAHEHAADIGFSEYLSAAAASAHMLAGPDRGAEAAAVLTAFAGQWVDLPGGWANDDKRGTRHEYARNLAHLANNIAGCDTPSDDTGESSDLDAMERMLTAASRSLGIGIGTITDPAISDADAQVLNMAGIVGAILGRLAQAVMGTLPGTSVAGKAIETAGTTAAHVIAHSAEIDGVEIDGTDVQLTAAEVTMTLMSIVDAITCHVNNQAATTPRAGIAAKLLAAASRLTDADAFDHAPAGRALLTDDPDRVAGAIELTREALALLELEHR